MTLRGVDKRTKRELKREKQKNEKRRAREGSQNYYVLYIVRCLKQHEQEGWYNVYCMHIFHCISIKKERINHKQFQNRRAGKRKEGLSF
jgi:hypothetical protein